MARVLTFGQLDFLGFHDQVREVGRVVAGHLSAGLVDALVVPLQVDFAPLAGQHPVRRHFFLSDLSHLFASTPA